MKEVKGRCFEEVVNRIIDVGHEKLNAKLIKSWAYWAPETNWHELTMYVNKYVPKDSADPIAIRIYAILCDCKEKDMWRQLRHDGF